MSDQGEVLRAKVLADFKAQVTNWHDIKRVTREHLEWCFHFNGYNKLWIHVWLNEGKPGEQMGYVPFIHTFTLTSIDQKEPSDDDLQALGVTIDRFLR